MDCIICGNWFSSVIHDGACPTCSRAIKQLGLTMTPTRLLELAQAERGGRLVVLPVPVGAGKVAYGLTDSGDGPQRIVTIECDYLEKLEIWDNPGHEVAIEVDGWEIGESDIGKTVFLTREEAEAALKKKEADNEAD